MSTDIVDAELVETGTDIEPLTAAPPASLFGTSDPTEVIVRATATADALKDVLKARGLVQNIQGREHVRVEGWSLLGSMLGVTGVVQWTRPVENGWEARVEARTLDGRVIGAAEAECLRTERMWSKRDDYALRSMAQTRAMSKALRGPLGFVVHLAGYETTPAEEMPASEPATPPVETVPGERPMTQEQFDGIQAAFLAQDRPAAELTAWLDANDAPANDDLGARILSIGATKGAKLTKWFADRAIESEGK